MIQKCNWGKSSALPAPGTARGRKPSHCHVCDPCRGVSEQHTVSYSTELVGLWLPKSLELSMSAGLTTLSGNTSLDDRGICQITSITC